MGLTGKRTVQTLIGDPPSRNTPGAPSTPDAGGVSASARTLVSITAETGREFDKLATHLATPRDSPNPGGELGSQPRRDAPVNYFRPAEAPCEAPEAKFSLCV